MVHTIFTAENPLDELLTICALNNIQFTYMGK